MPLAGSVALANARTVRPVMRATAVDAAAISVRARVRGDVLRVVVGDGERRAPDLADGEPSG